MKADEVPLTQLLALAAQGERSVLDRVFEALYPDLRRIAHARLRVQGGVAHLNTTALVNESFLHMVGVGGLPLTDRKHFFTYAAKTMRNIIIDFAREHMAQRRGGGVATLHMDTDLANELSPPGGDTTLIAVNDALLALEALDADLSQIVEMRFFAGYTEAEIAQMLDISDRTVSRRWEKARMFLLASLKD